MKIFEFHFNPNSKPDLIFDSFCYEPANSQEKKLGSLYIVAELKNAIPQNSRLIHNIALLLKREYYFGSSPEQAFKKALKKANEFLSERTKTGNVSWLGNLSLSAISLHDLDLNFSKDGKIKMFLLRPGQITDIGKIFEIEEFEPYPLKIFTNIVSGKFLENDKILILTNDVFELFLKTGLLDKISLAQDQRELKDLFRAKEKEFSDISGICFLLFLAKEASPNISMTFKKMSASFSLKEILSPILRTFSKSSLKKAFLKLRLPTLPKISLPKLKIKLPKFKFPLASLKFHFDWQEEKTKKNLFLVFLLICFLVLGFLFSKRESESKIISFRNKLIEVQEKTVKAQSYLVLGQDSKADSIFKQAFQEVLPLTKISSPVFKEAAALKSLIEKNLASLNKIEELVDPKPVFDFDNKGIVPQDLVFFEGSLYLFSSYYKGVVKLAGQGMEKIVSDYGFSLASLSDDGLILFSKPNKVLILKDNQFKQDFSLKLPGSEIAFLDLALFRNSLYFLEKDTGKVVKYFQPLSENKDQPVYWIQPQEKKAQDARSITVTGSVYVLTNNNSIWEYRGGRFYKEINLSVFPFPKKLARIVVSPQFSRLAVLEPSQGRIILIDRQGTLIKQFKSDAFLNLKDVSFSQDEKFLYVLSGLKVYQLDLR